MEQWMTPWCFSSSDLPRTSSKSNDSFCSRINKNFWQNTYDQVINIPLFNFPCYHPTIDPNWTLITLSGSTRANDYGCNTFSHKGVTRWVPAWPLDPRWPTIYLLYISNLKYRIQTHTISNFPESNPKALPETQILFWLNVTKYY